jgi:hypothetical protein
VQRRLVSEGEKWEYRTALHTEFERSPLNRPDKVCIPGWYADICRMGIARDSRHKRSASGARRAH